MALLHLCISEVRIHLHCWHNTNPSLLKHTQSSVLAPTLANGMHLKADVFQLLVVQDASTIEHEGWLHHAGMEVLVWVCLEFIPLRQHDDRMCTIYCLVRCL